MRYGFRRSSVSRIGGFLKSTLHDLGVQEKIIEQHAMSKWREVVGPQIAASSKPERVRDGVLFVTCKSSMWSNELSLHKQDILKRLNKAVNKEIIKEIHFSARGFRKTEPDKPKPENVDKSVDFVELGDDEIGVAEEVASICDSDELASRVKQAMITSKRLRQLRAKENEADG